MNPLKNEKGITLVMTIMILFIFSILGTALWQVASAQTRQVSMQEKKMKANFIARSGAEAMAKWIQKNQTTASTTFSETAKTSASQDFKSGEDGTFTVTVTKTSTGYKVQSQATVGGSVGGVSDNATINLYFTLPTDKSSIFDGIYDWDNTPESDSDWDKATVAGDQPTGDVQWIPQPNNGNIKSGNTADTEAGAVLFPDGVIVENQHGTINSNVFDFYAKYLLFNNFDPNDDSVICLSTKQKTQLNLHSEIIIFSGKVVMGNQNESIIDLYALYPTVINNVKYGKVYFYQDVCQSNVAGTVIIPKGGYYFQSDDSTSYAFTRISSTGTVTPALISIGSGSSSDSSQSTLWQ